MAYPNTIIADLSTRFTLNEQQQAELTALLTVNWCARTDCD